MSMLELRPYQGDSVESLRQGFREKHVRQVLAAPTGAGKCFGRDTPVLMANGSIVPVQDIRAGDALMGPDGKPRNVLSVTSGREMLYRVTPKKGDSYVVNGSHILSLRKTPGSAGLVLSDGLKIDRDADLVNVNVVTFARSNATARHCLKGWRAGAIESFIRDNDDDDRLIPPYILGAWLGDGTQGHAQISKPHCKMVEEWSAYGMRFGMNTKRDGREGDCPTWRLTNGRDGSRFNLIQSALRILGVLNDRHVPDCYKFAHAGVRRELLAGLIDSDGHITHGGCDWISKSEQLANDFAFLCRSVGLACYISKQHKTINGTDFEGWYWRASVSGDLSCLPMRDKVAPARAQKKRHLVHGITVEPLDVGDYYGFEVDDDHLFLLGDFTVTHNSRIMEYMIRAAMEKGSRIMFMCERRILVEQFSAHLDRAGIDHGILMAGHWRFRPDKLVQIASAQTLERMETLPAIDILFIDELHACLRASVIRMMENRPTLRIVGATATPFHPAIGKYFSNVVSVTSMAKLVEEKFLVPFRVFVAKEIDTSGLKVVAGEWKKDDLEKRGQQIVGDVVADYIRISHDVFGGYRKTICFSCGIAHGAELAQRFNEAGVNAVQISSEDNEEYRDEVLKDFARPDSEIKVVISVAILSRGFDQSDVDYVILARPLKKSFSEHVQMVGRGARIHPGKQFAVIQDNSGNFLRFKDEWDTLYNDGVQELGQGQDSKPKKEPTKEQKEAAKCPKCSVVWAGGDTCLNCGHVRVKRNEVVAVAGEMVEIGTTKKKADKYTAQQKADWYAQLIGYANFRGYKPGWAFHKYKDKFGVQPSMQKPEPASPSVAVTNWITSHNIRQSKGGAR